MGWGARRRGPGKLGSLWFPPPTPEWRGGRDRKGPVRLRLPGWPGAEPGRGPERRGRCSEAASCVARAGEGAEAQEPRPRVASQPIDPQGRERGEPRWTLGGGVSLKDRGANRGGAQGSRDRAMAAGRAQPEHSSACSAGPGGRGRVVTPQAPSKSHILSIGPPIWPLPEQSLAAAQLRPSMSRHPPPSPPHPHPR